MAQRRIHQRGRRKDVAGTLGAVRRDNAVAFLERMKRTELPRIEAAVQLVHRCNWQLEVGVQCPQDFRFRNHVDETLVKQANREIGDVPDGARQLVAQVRRTQHAEAADRAVGLKHLDVMASDEAAEAVPN